MTDGDDAPSASATYGNVWATDDEPIATWRALWTPSAVDASALFGWIEAALAAGEREAVVSFLELASIGWLRDRDGPLPAFLRRRHAETGVVDLLQCASRGQGVVRSVGRVA